MSAAAKQIYWNKRKFLHRESSTPAGFVWNMAAVLLFCNTNVADMTACENAL